MEDAALAELAQRRGSTYWLLSRLVLEAPSPEWLAELDGLLRAVTPDLAAPLGAETTALRDAVHEARADTGASINLAIQHTRLLGGLSQSYGPPPPYESVALEGKLPGEATIAVAAAYAEADFDPPAPEAGPPDHAGAELRFLALLCRRESEAWRSNDRNTALDVVERERAFLDDHVLRWLPDHCEKLVAAAEGTYHRAVLTLVARACLLDREDVEELPLADRTA